MKNFLLRLWRDESGGSGGRLALGVVGAGIGFAIGGPFGAAAFGAQLGFLGGTIVGNILSPQELPDIEGQRLDPNQAMSSAYGNPIAIGFGRFVVGGTSVYYPGFVEHEITEEVGGKGSTPSQTQRSYTYTGDFRVNFCEGPVDAILKIWMNRRLVYDATGTGGNQILDWTELNEAPGVQALRKYLGTETQEPDITEVADKGVNATPAYRGQVGAFFQNWPLDEYGGVPPQVTALISTSATIVLSATQHPSVVTANLTRIPGTNTFAAGKTVWDNGAQRPLGANGDISPDPAFPIIDGSGHQWSLSRGRTFKKFSTKTFQEIGTATSLLNPATGGSFGNNSVHWEDHIVFGGIVTPEGNIIGEKLAFFEQELDSTVWCVIDLDRWTNDFGGVMQVSSLADGEDTISESLIVDNEKFAWFMIKSIQGGPATLNRINPGTGLVDLTYTLDSSYSELSYDKWANNLIIHKSGDRLVQFSLDSGMETARLVYSGGLSPTSGNMVLWRDGCNPNGDMYLEVGAVLGDVQRFNVRGDMLQSTDDIFSMSGDFGLPSNLTHGGFFDVTRNAMIKFVSSGGN